MHRNRHGSTLHRRDAILKLLRQRAVPSQGGLRASLEAQGFQVTQPTLSRDIRELRLVKGPAGYILPPSDTLPVLFDRPVDESAQKGKGEKLDRALREFVLSVERVGALLVVKTPPAAAHPLARAIDEAYLPGSVGSLAGDDTIFLIARNSKAGSSLQRRLLAPVKPHPRRGNRRH